jgi:two-component system, NarL family, invasion response regulator UvrY
VELHRDYPSLPVLILSQYPAEQIAVRAIRSGASGYLNKESAPELLVAAVRRLRQGRRFLTDATADLLAESVESGSGLPHESLSSREFDVLRLIASGKTVSAIAAELHLSVKTISTYRGRILEKMNLKTNAEITYYAIRNGLVD